MGFRSFIKKVGRGVKKVLPYAAAALPFIPGVGTALSGAISTIGGWLGGGSSAQANAPPVMGPNDGPQLPQNQPVEVTGQRLATPPWYSVLRDAAPAFLGYLGQKQTNEASAQQAQAQMDFQNQQTSTSYQRGIADMKAAGLNPMLAYSQGGAASGSGAMAPMGNEIGAGVATAMQAQMQRQQLENMRSQVDNVDEDTENKRGTNALIQANVQHVKAQAASELLRPGVLTGQARQLYLDNFLKEATQDANIRKGHSAADYAADNARREKALADSARYDVDKSRVYSDHYKSDLGHSEPAMHYWTTVGNSAGNVFGKLNPFKFAK